MYTFQKAKHNFVEAFHTDIIYGWKIKSKSFLFIVDVKICVFVWVEEYFESITWKMCLYNKNWIKEGNLCKVFVLGMFKTA